MLKERKVSLSGKGREKEWGGEGIKKVEENGEGKK